MMGTSAPVREVIDIPIIRPKVESRELPAPSPERIMVPMVPVKAPVRVPERVMR